MRFLTPEEGQLGALIDDDVIDLSAAAQELSQQLAVTDMRSLVEAGDDVTESCWQLAQQALEKNVACRSFSDVRPMAPIPIPRRNILCMGNNYLDHAKELSKNNFPILLALSSIFSVVARVT